MWAPGPTIGSAVGCSCRNGNRPRTRPERVPGARARVRWRLVDPLRRSVRKNGAWNGAGGEERAMTSERQNRTSRGSGRDGPGGRPGAGSGGWSAGTMFGPAPEGFAAASGRSSTTPWAADGRRRRFFRRSEAARENSLNNFVVSLRTSAGMVWNGVGAVGVPRNVFGRAGRAVL